MVMILWLILLVSMSMVYRGKKQANQQMLNWGFIVFITVVVMLIILYFVYGQSIQF